MNESSRFTEVVKANQKVHTRFADIYETNEPHFRAENRDKVRQRIISAISSLPSRNRMLDVGCGTGFLIALVHDLFDQIDGVDVTQAMLDRVDLSPGNISLHNSPAEEIPLDSGSVNFAASYSFLDHVENPLEVFVEVFRVLDQGGVFYSDLIPNRSFWTALSQVDAENVSSALVQREYREVVEHEKKMKDDWNVEPEDWRLTEPGKAASGGFDAEELKDSLESAGFREVQIHFDWFLGEASVIHGKSLDIAREISGHLQAVRPLSDGLFKYLYFVAKK